MTDHTWRTLLGWGQIAGAAIGMATLLAGGPRGAPPDWGIVGLTISALFCALVGLAGWMLLRERGGAVALSTVCQALQVVRVVGPGFAYVVAAGPAVVVQVTNGSLGFGFSLGAGALVGAFPHAHWELSLNLFSLVALRWLVRPRRAGPPQPSWMTRHEAMR